MAPPRPSARDIDGGPAGGGSNTGASGKGSGGGKGGGGGKGSTATVPGRIGRPPQWTSTRSRKLARLYMYTTLSVDKILKVLEDDVFKPRKNSAQKTIHNMLDHDPRYLRPESREDMNLRLRLLSASSQRTRKPWKKRDATLTGPGPAGAHLHPGQPGHPGHPHPAHPGHPGHPGQTAGYYPEPQHGSYVQQQQQQSQPPSYGQPQHQQHPQHQQPPQQSFQHHQPPSYQQQQPPYAQQYQQPYAQQHHHQAPSYGQPQHPQQHHQQPQHQPRHHAAAYGSDNSEALLHGIKPDPGQGVGLPHLPLPFQHAQQHVQLPPPHLPPPQPQQAAPQQHQQYASQPPFGFLGESTADQQAYTDFYHPQYEPQQPPLSSLQPSIPPLMGGGWGGVYDHHQQHQHQQHSHAPQHHAPQHHHSHQQQAHHPAHQPPQQHHHAHAPQSAHHPQASSSFGLPQEAPLYGQQHASQTHHHQQGSHAQLPHLAGLPAPRGDEFPVPMYPGQSIVDHQHSQHAAVVADPYAAQQQHHHHHQHMGGGGDDDDDSDASSDVSTASIQELKHRLSGCSTHYANQVVNLLRRFTISSGSDDATPTPAASAGGGDPSPGPGGHDNADPDRLRRLLRKRQRRKRRRHQQRRWGAGAGSVDSATSGGSSVGGGLDDDDDDYNDDNYDDDDSEWDPDETAIVDDDDIVYGLANDDDDDDDDADDDTEIKNEISDDRRDRRPRISRKGKFHGPRIPGAAGDSAGNPWLALPGDLFNAYRYRNDATCPYHKNRQHQPPVKYENDSTRHGGARANKRHPEPRCWCGIADALTAAGTASASDAADMEDGSSASKSTSGAIWVLGDGRLTAEAQALLQQLQVQQQQQQQQQPQQVQTLPVVHHGRRDRFGHTLLHLLAARETGDDNGGSGAGGASGGAGGRDSIVMQMLLAAIVGSDDATLAATNLAGQTFLHLLGPGWFIGLHEPYAPLHHLLAHLQTRTPLQPAASLASSSSMSLHGIHGAGPGDDSAAGGAGSNLLATSGTASATASTLPGHLVYAADVYGRNFFHRLATFVTDPALLANIVQPYDRTALSARDAFAHVPLAAAAGSSATSTPPAATAPTPAIAGGNVPMVFSSEDAFIRHHESLLRIVTSCDSNPRAEDAEGRNGLHCLAEAIIDKRMMDEHRNALSSGRKPPKKKTLDRKEPAPLPTAGAGADHSNSVSPYILSTTIVAAGIDARSGGVTSGTATSTTTTGGTTTTTAATSPAGGIVAGGSLLPLTSDGAQMATRLRLVQGLLAAPTAVDVNHYDRRGQTVLTAFVVHVADDQEDKAKSLVAILETLLAAGARLEGRNRRGETALLVAARLGRKIALTTLLDHGANVHARDAAGRGVLDVIDTQCRREACRDVALYGRLEACRVLLTNIKQRSLGVKQRPTLLDEWTARHRRGPEPRDLVMM